MSDESVADLLETLRDDFLNEMPSRVDLIESEIMASPNNDTYDELFRMVHSLKGSAGSYNFHIITKIAHCLEDVMLLLMQKKKFGTASTVDILLKFIDIFRDTIDALTETKVAPLDIDERLIYLHAQIFKDGLNILVVEPSKLYTSMIEFNLRNQNINFTFTEDGLQALEHLFLQKYDLLITSLESTRLNGDALVAALRLGRNFNRKIKVILITSREPDKIANQHDFDEILDRKTVKDGGLKEIVDALVHK